LQKDSKSTKTPNIHAYDSAQVYSNNIIYWR